MLFMLKHRMIAFFIIVIAALVGYFVYASQTSMPFKLGLDLAGGTELVYTADVSKIQASEVSDSMTALRDTIERRVNIFGVSEPMVETETAGIFGSASTQNRLIVELPGVTDIDAAKAAIGATPVLEFYLIKTKDYTAITAKNLNATDTETAIEKIRIPTGITGSMLSKAALAFDPTTGAPIVSLQFNSTGAQKFADLTKNNIGDIAAIYLDGQPLELPTIREAINNGQAQITGGFTLDQAQGSRPQPQLWRFASADNRLVGTNHRPHPRPSNRECRYSVRHYRIYCHRRLSHHLVSLAGLSRCCRSCRLHGSQPCTLQNNPRDAHCRWHCRFHSIYRHGCGCQHPYI